MADFDDFAALAVDTEEESVVQGIDLIGHKASVIDEIYPMVVLELQQDLLLIPNQFLQENLRRLQRHDEERQDLVHVFRALLWTCLAHGYLQKLVLHHLVNGELNDT